MSVPQLPLRVSDRALQPNSWILLPLLTVFVQMMLMLVNAVAHGQETCAANPRSLHSMEMSALWAVQTHVFIKLQWKFTFQMLTLSNVNSYFIPFPHKQGVPCLWEKGIKYELSPSLIKFFYKKDLDNYLPHISHK